MGEEKLIKREGREDEKDVNSVGGGGVMILGGKMEEWMRNK